MTKKEYYFMTITRHTGSGMGNMYWCGVINMHPLTWLRESPGCRIIFYSEITKEQYLEYKENSEL